MESFGTRFVIALMMGILLVSLVTKTMAQDLALAPTSGLETGAETGGGFALSLSGASTFFSLFISLMALLQRFHY
ncbi:hypothetical protein CsatB_016442 [Cannabis sativa]